ncbi:MAG: ABC transporter substrate-binding protein [Flavobacteriales bacterium]
MNKKPKICSFLPAVTSMINEMGMEEYLSGVTFECPSDKPVVVNSVIEENDPPAHEIEAIVREKMQNGEELYSINKEKLADIQPDIIFTQDVCEACQIDTNLVKRSIDHLDKKPEIVPLNPRNLSDVFENARTIAEKIGEKEKCEQYFKSLNERLRKIKNSLQNKNKREVMVMEWTDPIYNCGHWIPDQIEAAGGVDKLSNPEGYSEVVSFNKVLEYDPEVIVVAPCGFDEERARQESEVLKKNKGWEQLRAVKNDNVHFLDSNLFTCPSTTLVDGIEKLSRIF